MTTKLTNKLTRTYFYTTLGYCMIEFNGSVTDAKIYVKRNYAANIDYHYTTIRSAYLPIGYCSFEVLESTK